MPNTIATGQDEPQLLRHFAASRVWYRRAKRMAALQATLATVFPLISAYFLATIPGDLTRTWTTVFALTLSLFEVLLLEPTQKRWRKNGANEQEMFDCAVLGLPWPTGLA